MNREQLEECIGQEFRFNIRRVISDILVDEALLVNSSRVKTYAWLNQTLMPHIRLLFTYATQEEEVFDYPADWWQWFKQRWFPEWLIKRYPIRMARIWAIHSFPELNIPDEFVGREFVHFRIVNEDKLTSKISENP